MGQHNFVSEHGERLYCDACEESVHQDNRNSECRASAGAVETFPSFTHDREMEVALLIQPQLEPEERRILDLWFGLNGNARLTPAKIARRLNMSKEKVEAVQQGILAKMKPHLPED